MFIEIPYGAIRTSKIDEVYMEKTEEDMWGIFIRLNTGESRVIDIVSSEGEAEKAIEKIREELNSLERGG